MLSKRHTWMMCVVIGVFCTGSSDVDAKIFAALALILVGAKLVGDVFERMGQPAVLGELLAGIVLGNLSLLGIHELDFITTNEQIALLAELGVILLLFEVGLESDLVEMARVGGTAFLVAVIGVITPVTMGYFVHAAFSPSSTWHTHLFIGAVLAATSVGITARVLKDIGKIDSPTARVVLGAAVIDDVLGLVVLAVVVGIVEGANTGASLHTMDVVMIVVKATGFLGGAILLGRPVSRALFRFATKLRVAGVLLAVSLGFCFALSYGAGAAGLAPIVGAFAAGIVLDALTFQDLESKETHKLEHLMHPLTSFLVPVFFVVTGAKVQLGTLNSFSILGLALALTAVAIIGKQACSLVAVGKGINRFAVGLGMVPRGEVGLIFASVGEKLKLHGEPVVNNSTYAAVVFMVMATTMVTPPVLAWALRKGESKD